MITAALFLLLYLSERFPKHCHVSRIDDGALQLQMTNLELASSVPFGERIAWQLLRRQHCQEFIHATLSL